MKTCQALHDQGTILQCLLLSDLSSASLDGRCALFAVSLRPSSIHCRAEGQRKEKDESVLDAED